MGKVTIALRFGFLAPKMDKQLRPQGFRLPPRHCADEVNIAISTLRLGKFITERQCNQARQKLCDRVCRDAIPLRARKPHPTPTEPSR